MIRQRYYDESGAATTLEALCRSTPEWAASRIEHMRETLRARETEIKLLALLYEAAAAHLDNTDPEAITCGHPDCTYCRLVVATEAVRLHDHMRGA
jgi:hypothetical protein